MFTGIIDHCGQIIAIDKTRNSVKLTISTQYENLVPGESIAVDGACLTVTFCAHANFTVELSPETIRFTTAASYQCGTQVNLERSLRLMDRLGGHFVTGHIDGCGKVSKITSHQGFTEIEFDGFSPSFCCYLTRKGSIAVNGVSLTLNAVEKHYFSVMLIPHTLERTNLSLLRINDKINLEFDYLAKLVRNQLRSETV